MRLLGLDPGLRCTGWGVIDCDGVRLAYVASGTVRPDSARPLADRLAALHEGLRAVIAEWRPDAAAIEETFVNKNPGAALKLGQARGVALLTPALAGIEVAEYHNRTVKLAVVGTGRAAKRQVEMMVRRLLRGADPGSADAADALAVAICHAHHSAARNRRAGAGAGVAA